MATDGADAKRTKLSAIHTTVHVEACVRDDCSLPMADVHRLVAQFLQSHRSLFVTSKLDFRHDAKLSNVLKYLAVADVDEPVPPSQAELSIHIFQLSDEGPANETVGGDGAGEEEVTTCSQWVLPALELDGLWENLIYDHEIKRDLLEYAHTAMLFADCKVNTKVIAWNRVVLLHGPPGTGKTSLCKALAQKLTIRLLGKFSAGQLIEINAHSLFSKWFSESGKLVMKLFEQIQELVEDSDTFVCVMIDEVESLSAARKSSMGGSEPSDAIRVVNALLTQIDKLSRFPNVLVLTTSNITGAIDIAFVDRADIKQYIGLPSSKARGLILSSCMSELERVGIVRRDEGLGEEAESPEQDHEAKLSARFAAAIEKADGLSGRALRKIPFQAHAFFIQKPSCSREEFVIALDRAIEKEQANRLQLNTN
eukprot:INCI4303.1.p1 GENE.INCI4303.1~~INCI4303.1.p1  ORF type:complete len:424 (-),score=81.91 INCI4303.1:745-2016(-)